ncbi:hypothetical protein Hanom_Chr02g00141081 [Helianthus anomalus]
MGTDGMGAHYVQTRYTLLRLNGTEQKITHGDLADQLHPLDILFMKNHYENEIGNKQFLRKPLKSIAKARITLFGTIAFADFDLSINYDYVHQKKVHLPPPGISIPLELKDHARTREMSLNCPRLKKDTISVLGSEILKIIRLFS